MSQTVPAAIATHYDTRATTVAHGMKVVRALDSAIYGFTTHDISDTVNGVLYKSAPGMDIGRIVIAAGNNVGNTEMTVLRDAAGITQDDLMMGKWRNSDFLIMRYNWNSLGDGQHNLLAGKFGESRQQTNAVIVELRDLRQILKISMGSPSSKNCRYRLGSTSKWAGGLCFKNVSSSPFTVTGTITNVTDNATFRDSGRAEVDDYFGEGSLRWTGGLNSGLTYKVKSFTPGGNFVLDEPTYKNVQVGDTYSATSGCRKRYIEDCIGKYDNGVNHGGEPHRKGLNNLTAAPDINV